MGFLLWAQRKWSWEGQTHLWPGRGPYSMLGSLTLLSAWGGLVAEQKIDGGSIVVTEGLDWDYFSSYNYVTVKPELWLFSHWKRGQRMYDPVCCQFQAQYGLNWKIFFCPWRIHIISITGKTFLLRHFPGLEDLQGPWVLWDCLSWVRLSIFDTIIN